MSHPQSSTELPAATPLDHDAALDVADLVKQFPTRSGTLSILRGISFRLAPGASLAVMGPSGSGKSTLLHILGTLDQPTTGRVRIAGTDPFELPDAALAGFRNRTIGFVFQDHHLLPQCSVLENVLVPTLVAAATPPEVEDRARSLLDRVGLSGRLDHLPAELSGGERQRAALARALINRPRLLLCDEPTGNLDRVSGATVADLLVELQQQEGTTLVVVTHSPSLAGRFGQRVELVDGRLERVEGSVIPGST